MESKVFSTVTEFEKEYISVRNGILLRHGYELGAKNVRLKNAMVLYQKLNGQWFRTSSVKTDMSDRIKVYRDKNPEFKLVALV